MTLIVRTPGAADVVLRLRTSDLIDYANRRARRGLWGVC
jgi:hypothetical protein